MTAAESPFRSAEAMTSGEKKGKPEDAILFVGVSLVLGVVSRQMCKGTRVPYTVALLILGIALGAIEYGTENGLGSLGDSIEIWSNINPELILFVFLPALLFESSFAMEVHQIKRCIMQMVLLAGPGVLISTALLALVNRFVFPYGWNWSTCLLLGGLLSATDPVAVVALLKDLGASKKLRTIVEGESLMNDGTAIVVYGLFVEMVMGKKYSAAEVVKFFAQSAFGGVALGIGFGLFVALWIGRVFNDTLVEITLTLTASYLAFFVAEDEAEVSGILTVMTIGMFFAAYAKTAFTGESQESMHHFWEMVSYVANTLIFILSGTVIAESVLRSRDRIQGRDWGYLVLLYVFLQLSRAAIVIILYPGLRYFGYGMDWKEATILSWSGLRGAVALSLSLSVSKLGASTPDGYMYITKQTEARFVFFTGGVVLLTLIINGSTTQFLLGFLHMDRTSETKALILQYVRHEMHSRARESFADLGEDEDLGPAEWNTVQKYISCLEQVSSQGAPTHPHEATSPTEEQAWKLAFQDTRIRFLNGVQASYWGMLGEGRITRTAGTLLTASVDEALDLAAQDVPLRDWDGVRPYVKFPEYLKWKSSTLLPHCLMTYVTVQQLELACYMAAAFLRAHRHAQQHLRNFMGESEIADAVIRESQNEGQAARDFLDDVRLSFPQVLRVIKNKQVTYAVLEHLSKYVESLEEAGLLDSRETTHLQDNIQADLKRLQRKPPSVEMLSPEEALRRHPFFGALPGYVQIALANKAKELIFMRDSVIYEEGGRADGVFLIVNGNVKWSGTKFDHQHVLHPVFPYGTTMGLYEALTGKRRRCSVVADSVVHAFLIDAERLMSTMHSEPRLEEFFWQEGALVAAKLVLPQLESLTVQEVRALIIESPPMRTYIRGEVIEVEHGHIGLLLEGFVKQEGVHDVVSAPAGLFAASEDKHRPNKGQNAVAGGRTGTLEPHSVYFHAEARSRVLFLDRPSGQPTPPALSSTSSLLSSRHNSLVQTLSKYRSSRGRLWDVNSIPNVKSPADPPNDSADFWAKAMELSLFGNQVNGGALARRGNAQILTRMSSAVLEGESFRRPFFSDYTLRSAAKPEEAAQHGQRRVRSHGNLTVKPPSPRRPPVPAGRRARRHTTDSSSGESDEDHIVEIASPSSLFQA